MPDGLPNLRVRAKAEEDAREAEYRRIFASYFRSWDHGEMIVSEVIIAFLGLEDGYPKGKVELQKLFDLSAEEVDFSLSFYDEAEFRAYACGIMGIPRQS